MSLEKTIYIGPYILLDNFDWYSLIEDLDIHIDELIKVPNESGVLISNYTTVNFYNDNADSQHIEFKKEFKNKAQELFLEQHSKTLNKLEKHLKQKIEIKFGFISYLDN